MPTRSPAYHRPTDLAEAVALLGDNPTDSAPLLLGPRPPVGVFPDRSHLVDIADLELTQIAETNAGRLSLGTALPLQAFIENPWLSTLADGVLAEATRLAGHPGLRQVATLGGVLLDPASPPEIRLVLLALQASVVTLGKARRETQLIDFAPTPGELPIAVTLIADSAQRGALMRVARSPVDRAIVAAVAVLTVTGGVCRDGRLAVAGASPQPLCLTVAELGLAGQAWTPERVAKAADVVRQAARPLGDYLGSATYRREMAGVLAGRALAEAWRRAQS